MTPLQPTKSKNVCVFVVRRCDNGSGGRQLSVSMDTGLGSPRSSSGYGSSEEDHHQACSTAGLRRRRRNSLVRTPTPQTPQSLSPSDTASKA